jgi:endonuclease YncB( thermonuclease family)
MGKRRRILLLFLLIAFLIAINYSKLDKITGNFLADYEEGTVTRIIDGDTLEMGNESIRLLGINTPEKGELYYKEAKELLTTLVLNKTVRLEKEKEDKDRYGRKLRYIFLNGENINLKLIENGFANAYFPSGKTQHYREFEEAWGKCVEKNINLCEKSQELCAKCVVLGEFDYDNEKIVLKNTCTYACNLKNWSIKDEGRKKFSFPEITLQDEITIRVGSGTDQESVLFWKGQDYVWTQTGDTLFLRDSKGKLVLFHTY